MSVSAGIGRVRVSAIRGSLAIMLLGVVSCFGCRVGEADSDRMLAARFREALCDQTGRVFLSGVYFKPKENPEARDLIELAPLIVQEAVSGDSGVSPSLIFGAVNVDAAGGLVVDVSRPTIYFARSAATAGGRDVEQISFLWFYPAGDDSDGATIPAWRGFRMTLDEEGFPIVWEVFCGSGGKVVSVYVSDSLERAAAGEYGPALPGRRFSIERSVDAQPFVVVARVLEDGPVPMGPFVYLDAAGRDITTLLCRCMPSQVRSFVEERYYDLRPLSDLAAVNAVLGDGGSMLPTHAADVPPGGHAASDPLWLDRALRLPGGGNR